MTVSATTEIRRAARRLEKAELSLEIAVAQAHTSGMTWAQIANALRLNIGAVQHRYGSSWQQPSKVISAPTATTILPSAPEATFTFQQGADSGGSENP